MVELREWQEGDAKVLAELLNNKKILDNLDRKSTRLNSSHIH